MEEVHPIGQKVMEVLLTISMARKGSGVNESAGHNVSVVLSVVLIESVVVFSSLLRSAKCFIFFKSSNSKGTLFIKGLMYDPLPKTFLIREEIGKGAFSKIYKAFDSIKARDVAIKVIRKKTVIKIRKQIETEIQLLQKLDHPNIVQCFGVYEDHSKIFIVMEYCSKGDLSDLLKVSFLTEDDVKDLFQGLVSALQYLHKQNVMHRDLKPKNILVSDDDKLKIADFGFAKHLSTDLSQTICGSPLYMAPEILNSSPYASNSDLWSVGIVLYEMISGKTPYFAKNLEDLKKNIHEVSQFDMIDSLEVSYACKELLFQLLDINKSSRMSWDEFFSHTWLTSKPVTENPFDETVPDPPLQNITDNINEDFLPSSIPVVSESELLTSNGLSFEDLIREDDAYVLVETPNKSDFPIVKQLRKLSRSIWNSLFTFEE